MSRFYYEICEWAIGPFFVCGRTMRSLPEALEELIRQPVEMLGYELVGIELTDQGHGKLLRIYIDKEGGIVVNDCSSVSHQVSGVLEVEDPIRGNYFLEVSSPGVDRPLFYIEHYQKFCGKKVKIKMASPFNGRRKFTGQLVAVEGEIILLEEDGTDYEIPFNLIDSARLVVEF
ncbi:MAG: ribosome maturation factor RimP [Candidatus Polarisedimenticolaceae bacterium]|nr:ribosome maturation factor RimP [Candidatus Polarisedimenticolaceae bacterium]